MNPYRLFNSSVGASFAEGHCSILAWINKALEKRRFQNLSTTAIVGTSPFAYAGQLGTPRTAVATIRVRF